jgi:hypothetical protein
MMAADNAIPADDDETVKMLESQVTKGMPRKFILICKGAAIKTLIIFKKGPYGTKITSHECAPGAGRLRRQRPA